MFSIIVAMGKQNEIGKDNKLLWHIPEDLQNFKKITTGKKIIMGRKTFESIGRPLPNRENIVLSKTFEYIDENVSIYTDIFEVIKLYEFSDEEVFIIGGSEIYHQFLPYVKKLYISHIELPLLETADSFFPILDTKLFQLVLEEQYKNWKFCVYNKK